MNRVMLNVTENGTVDNGGPTLKRRKDSAELTPAVEAWLRGKYERGWRPLRAWSLRRAS